MPLIHVRWHTLTVEKKAIAVRARKCFWRVRGLHPDVGSVVTTAPANAAAYLSSAGRAERLDGIRLTGRTS